MTPRTAFRRSLAAAGVLLAGLAVLSPTAVSAAQDDSLDQTLDPNQAQGTGQVVLDHGHADFGPTLNTGEWIIQIHDDTASPSYWRHLEDVVLRVNDTAILPVPDSDAYGFLGQQPGDEVWVVPQTQKPDVVWAGWNTQEPNVLNSLNLGTTFNVLGVHGPGDVVVYLQSGNFGDPQRLWSSREPFPQQSWIEVNTHTHANWVFTEPGVYLVDIQFDADLITGESVTARDTLRFAVGDATDAQQAFQTVIDDTPTGDATEEPGTITAEAPSKTSEGGLGTIVWLVVGAIAAVLVAAILIVVIASRRARTRALAARARKDADE
ncbi:hypothetical protein GCM10027416_16670 [Okibacterium endophyticum]